MVRTRQSKFTEKSKHENEETSDKQLSIKRGHKIPKKQCLSYYREVLPSSSNILVCANDCLEDILQKIEKDCEYINATNETKEKDRNACDRNECPNLMFIDNSCNSRKMEETKTENGDKGKQDKLTICDEAEADLLDDDLFDITASQLMKIDQECYEIYNCLDDPFKNGEDVNDEKCEVSNIISEIKSELIYINKQLTEASQKISKFKESVM